MNLIWFVIMDTNPLLEASMRINQEMASFGHLSVNLEASELEQRGAIVTKMLAEPASRRLLDQACREWIATGQWPLMGTDSAILISDRLAEAVLFSGILLFYGFSYTQKTANELLELFLIDYWERFGVKRQWSYSLVLPEVP